MIKTTRVNNNVISFINGKMYVKHCLNLDEVLHLFELAANTDADDEEDVQILKDAFVSEEIKEEERKMAQLRAEREAIQCILDWMQELREDNSNSPFEVIGNRMYVKNINISIPENLILEFYNRKDDPQSSLAILNFWMRAALNPDPRCRESLFGFIERNGISLTPSGLFVAYRNANIKREGPEAKMEEAILKAYFSIRKKKKATKDYGLFYDEEKDLYFKEKLKHGLQDQDTFVYLGVVKDLYHALSDIPEEDRTIYTDAYSGTTTIIIGEKVAIPRSECDSSPDRTCSRGLHLSSSHWLSQNYFGEQGLVALVDPRNVVSVPYEDFGKLRCCEYFPIGLAEYDENGKIIPIKTDIFEHNYSADIVETLEKLIQESAYNFEEYKQHDIIPLELSLGALKQIQFNLEEATKCIQNRVVDIN